MQTIAKNRRASFDYLLGKKFEAGLVLLGSEVKSMRFGKASISNAYIAKQGEGFYLLNSTVSLYSYARNFNHDETRPRKLLLKKNEVKKLTSAVKEDQMTIVPTHLFFNNRGYAKLDIALAKGKKKADKRHALKEKDWKRRQSRILKTSSY